MNRQWYNRMHRLGKATGYGMTFVIRLHRSTAASKSHLRMKTVCGEPQPLFEGSRMQVVPIMNKRTRKVLAYRVVSHA